MIRKKYLCLTTLLAILVTIAIVNVPVRAAPMVRIYVNMPPQGYIDGIPPGQMLMVDIYIETDIIDNSPDGIVQYSISAQVDPSVLEPMGAMGATSGYFLYDYLVSSGLIWMGYSTGPVMVTPDKTAGTLSWVTEGIMPDPATGAGGSGKLCTLVFKSLSETEYSPIDLFYEVDVDAWYWTPGGVPHVADVVEDGLYCWPPIPEFPLGIGLMMILAPMIPVAYLWRLRKKEEMQ
jgi:hypothetical protein